MSKVFPPAAQGVIIAASVVIIIAGMKAAASLLLPFLLALFIVIICFPLTSRLQQKGMPRGLSIVLVISLVIVIGVGMIVLIGNSLSDFSQTLPFYRQQLTSQWNLVIQWMSDNGITAADKIRDAIDPSSAVGLVSSILNGFGNLLSKAFVILLAVSFMMTEAAGFAQKLAALEATEDESRAPGERAVSQVFAGKLRNYIGIKTISSLVTGVIIGLALWLIGVDYPVLWGLLAFMLNFVPSIGSIIAAIPAVLLALVQLGFATALAVAAIYLVVNIAIGSVIEPRFLGKGLGLSTMVVFFSLVFWGWVLGPVGMLLSVPLTIIVKLALDSNPDTRWMGHLLGPVES
ncbi:MAG: AI-2E family transporter [Gammaproteobacteria bacterium]|nr:AI-2E family transporter [Gammaproteobacteria bacterium]